MYKRLSRSGACCCEVATAERMPAAMHALGVPQVHALSGSQLAAARARSARGAAILWIIVSPPQTSEKGAACMACKQTVACQ
jgi:hypothetical protein